MSERVISAGGGSRESKLLCCGIVLAGLTAFAGAAAAERLAYRYVDENGAVAYSQFPPTGVASKKVDTTTAVTGRSGGTPRPKYGDESRYSSLRRDASPDIERKQAKIAAQAREKKLVAAAAEECRRNHGIGCKTSRQ